MLANLFNFINKLRDSRESVKKLINPNISMKPTNSVYFIKEISLAWRHLASTRLSEDARRCRCIFWSSVTQLSPARNRHMKFTNQLSEFLLYCLLYTSSGIYRHLLGLSTLRTSFTVCKQSHIEDATRLMLLILSLFCREANPIVMWLSSKIRKANFHWHVKIVTLRFN